MQHSVVALVLNGCKHLCSPNEDFGRLNKALRVRFEVLFKCVSTLFGRPLIENLFKNAYATLSSTLENYSFGEHNIVINSKQT